jgi:hypothetical protein
MRTYGITNERFKCKLKGERRFPLILTKVPYPLASDNERRHTDLKKRNTVEKETLLLNDYSSKERHPNTLIKAEKMRTPTPC